MSIALAFSPGPGGVDAAILAWRRHLTDKGAAARTVAAYESDVRAFLDTMRCDALGQLSGDRINAIIEDQKARGRSASSLARLLSSLRAFFRFLAGEGIAVPALPRGIKAEGSPVRPSRVLNRTEAERVLALVPHLSDDPTVGQRDAALFALLFGCGLSIGEVLALNRRDAPRNGVLMAVGPRGPRRVPVPHAIQGVVDAYLRLGAPRDEEGPLFVGVRGGRLNPGVVQRQMRRLRGHLDLSPGVTPRSLRHAFAMELAAGGNAAVVQERLGHTRRSAARRYVKRLTEG